MPNGLLALLYGTLETLILGIPYASSEAKSAERTKAPSENYFYKFIPTR